MSGVFKLSDDSILEVASSVFVNNEATESGGVLELEGNATLSFSNCTFQHNSAGVYGSVLYALS